MFYKTMFDLREVHFHHSSDNKLENNKENFLLQEECFLKLQHSHSTCIRRNCRNPTYRSRCDICTGIAHTKTLNLKRKLRKPPFNSNTYGRKSSIFNLFCFELEMSHFPKRKFTFNKAHSQEVARKIMPWLS